MWTDRLHGPSLDRYITGNYGEDREKPWDCPDCGARRIDPDFDECPECGSSPEAEESGGEPEDDESES